MIFRGKKLTTLVASVAPVLLLLMLAPAATAVPSSEEIYAGGRTYSINTGAAVHLEAGAGMLAKSEPFYIIRFPVAPGTTGPITLPSGYQPQNNGLPAPIPYHDHIAAELANPLRRVVEMRYTTAYAYSPAFVPLTSVEQITEAEASGILDVVDPSAPDPYQHWTSTVLVRPVVLGR